MLTKKIQYGLYFTILLLLGCIYYFYDPAQYQLFPKCFFTSVTGLSCPGCGSQRAVHELLHFNFKSAFAFNPLVVGSIPYALVGLLFYQTNFKEKFPKIRQFLFGTPTLIFLAALVLFFFIYRNL